MKIVKVQNTKDACRILQSDEYKEIVIDFDINADDFFLLSGYWAEKGAKIKKEEGRFKIKPKN